MQEVSYDRVKSLTRWAPHEMMSQKKANQSKFQRRLFSYLAFLTYNHNQQSTMQSLNTGDPIVLEQLYFLIKC